LSLNPYNLKKKKQKKKQSLWTKWWISDNKTYAFKWLAKFKGKYYVPLHITVLIKLYNTLCSGMAHISHQDMWHHENCKILLLQKQDI
jgi:hypothetical protein